MNIVTAKEVKVLEAVIQHSDHNVCVHQLKADMDHVHLAKSISGLVTKGLASIDSPTPNGGECAFITIAATQAGHDLYTELQKFK